MNEIHVVGVEQDRRVSPVGQMGEPIAGDAVQGVGVNGSAIDIGVVGGVKATDSGGPEGMIRARRPRAAGATS